jgi:hypothetical protein
MAKRSKKRLIALKNLAKARKARRGKGKAAVAEREMY